MKLTEEEKIILENTDKRYKYIVRDESDLLVLFARKPKKEKSIGEWRAKYCGECWFSAFNHLFQGIQWEDEEPYKFR